MHGPGSGSHGGHERLIHVRPGTEADFRRIYGHGPERSMRMYAVDKDGDLAAVFGFYLMPSYRMAFCNIKGKHRPREIIEVARLAMQMLLQFTDELYAQPEPGLMSAPGFLKHLGFELAHKSSAGDIYRCQAVTQHNLQQAS